MLESLLLINLSNLSEQKYVCKLDYSYFLGYKILSVNFFLLD